jgi:enolase-phosphatase E1
MGRRAILTDIEGTTSSLSFVKDVLFPFARSHLPGYVRQHAHEPAVRAELDATAREAGLDPDKLDTLIAQLLRWIDEDRKITPLKTLQGMIWHQGYRDGAFVAHVYDDALAALQRWHRAGHALYVYSSGSVPAQKLYFAHTTAGDLSPLFSGYFDTMTGPKKDPDSYRRIAQSIGVVPADVVFLSDQEGEVDAAHAAGMATVWVRREIDAAATLPSSPKHQVVRDFDAIEP